MIVTPGTRQGLGPAAWHSGSGRGSAYQAVERGSWGPKGMTGLRALAQRARATQGGWHRSLDTPTANVPEGGRCWHAWG